MTLASAYGRFNTSHVAACPDVAPECASIFIPHHRHVVTLDLFHTELYSKSLSDESFRQGTTWSLTLTRFF